MVVRFSIGDEAILVGRCEVGHPFGCKYTLILYEPYYTDALILCTDLRTETNYSNQQYSHPKSMEYALQK